MVEGGDYPERHKYIIILILTIGVLSMLNNLDGQSTLQICFIPASQSKQLPELDCGKQFPPVKAVE